MAKQIQDKKQGKKPKPATDVDRRSPSGNTEHKN
jgi:hypothetical protein